MKNIILLILLWGCGLTIHAQESLCQNSLVDQRVDSLFQMRFCAINKAIQTDHRLTRDETLFIYLLTFMSGIGKEMYDYSGSFKKMEKKDLENWKKWYKNKKGKINWQNHILNGIGIIESFPVAKDIEEMEENGKALDKLYIE